ncbi:MAG: hypothetical protein JNL87_12925 [Burkholderiaceae bacterium]|nr:hypothetical protein [Burkholderiaceae bacterium]
MDVSAVITRLAAQLSGFVVVAGAADLDAAIELAPATPAAYVLPLAETADAPALISVHEQRVVQAFGVVLVVSNLRDATGAAAAAELATRRQAVRAALVGWVPDAATGLPVGFTGGRLLQFRDGRLWWADDFELTTYYRTP